MLPRRSKIAFIVDIIAAGSFVALAGWLYYESGIAAATAVREYGHNVDSGAIEPVVAALYCGPAAAAFSVAAVSLYYGWRIKWYLHWLALLVAVVPVVVEILP
jgi:hypothetical protein